MLFANGGDDGATTCASSRGAMLIFRQGVIFFEMTDDFTVP
jgi:hypothetical protein